MMKPDQQLFACHLMEAPFLAGVDSGKWGLHGESAEIIWPTPIIWIEADKRFVPSGRIYLKVNMENYSAVGPTACPWDVGKNAGLENSLWPKGPGNISAVFNPGWKNYALYAPCDRIAMEGHEAWKAQFPRWWWQSTFTFVTYLEFVHRCLNPNDHDRH